MTKLQHRQLLLAKTESAYGTDSNPTAAANSILVSDVTYSDSGLRMVARPALRGNSIAGLQSIYAGQLRQLSFTCEVKGSGAAGTAPEIDPLLQACAMSSTVVASTSVTYAPVSDTADMKSCTLYLYLDGSLMKLTGCYGTVNFSAKTGALVEAAFTMTGHISSDYTDEALPAAAFNETVPVAALDIPVVWGSYDPTANTLTFDVGNTVTMPEALNTTDGYGNLIISARAPKGTLDPYLDSESAFNWFQSLTEGTLANFSVGAIGATAGNKVTFNFPQSYVTKIADGNSNGILTATVDFSCIESSTVNTDYSIVFE